MTNHVSNDAVGYAPAQLVVDLDAVANNAQFLQRKAPDSALLAVVKADAYGHGIEAVSRRLWDEGVRWFGVSHFDEALQLRSFFDSQGIGVDEARILTWLGPATADLGPLLDAGLDVSVSSLGQLQAVSQAVGQPADQAGKSARPARIHLKVDVGMGRGGETQAELPQLVEAIEQAEAAGLVELVGFWSHLPSSDDPDHTVTDQQIAAFEDSYQLLLAAGLAPQLRHLSATGGVLWHPDAHFDMVRPGLGLFGLTPRPLELDTQEPGIQEAGGLTPAARFETTIIQVKQLLPGQSVSYSQTWTATEPTWVGLLPLGYADGVPRALSNRGVFAVQTQEGLLPAPILGRVCMDQIVIDLGVGPEPLAKVGDRVILFGDPSKGHPSVEEWAQAADTINYEVVARLPHHIPRTYGSTSD